MRKQILAGNWKMNLNYKKAKEIAVAIQDLKTKPGSKECWVFPSHLHVPGVQEILKNSEVLVGIQNFYPSDLTAMTGETSPLQAEEFGIQLGLVGHSERRQFLHETNLSCKEKIQFLLQRNWTVCYCVGEKLEERESGQTFSVLKNQIQEALQGIPKENAKNIVIAYEPVWAIGTGKTATPTIAQEAHQYIRDELNSLWDKETADGIPILYGGSIKPDNFLSLIEQPDIDGGLVGGASQSKESFLSLIETFFS